MFLVNLHYKNARLNSSGHIDFCPDHKFIKKWTFFPESIENLELLRMIAISCIGKKFLPDLRKHLRSLCLPASPSAHLEFITICHPPRDCSHESLLLSKTGLKILNDGEVKPFQKCEYQHTSPSIPKRQPNLGSGIRKNFALAYGPAWTYHSGSDCFDFSKANFRVVRFLSLFDDQAHLTDPVAFLNNLRYRFSKGRKPAIIILKKLTALFKQHFSVDTSHWIDKGVDFKEEWLRLDPYQLNLIVPIIDAVRHIMDASPHDLIPTERPGIVLFASPQNFSQDEFFTHWIEALDALFPNIQFIISTRRELVDQVSSEILSKRLEVPRQPKPRKCLKKTRLGRLNKDTVLLVDIDGRLPNLALMKLSSYFQRQNKKTVLVRHDKWIIDDAEEIYASCIFNFSYSLRRIKKLKDKFGSKLTIGGSGVNLKLRLPDEVEQLPADYDLYPELNDRAIGFLTRGCPNKCSFCVVPEKDGLTKQVTTLDELLRGRRKLVLLDDNILAHPKADTLLEEIAAKDIQVNFNQTLDIHFVNKERAKLIKRIKCSNYSFTRSNYYFSLNGIDNLDMVRQKYNFFKFNPRDNVQFVCMYGYNTSLEEDVKRFRFLKSLPGAYVFVQAYRPIIGRKKPDDKDFFNNSAHELIDELISIIFPQNMKSMEQYYRWLSALYFKSFGELHANLVDTIFRYNQRDRKSQYIARMMDSKIMHCQ